MASAKNNYSDYTRCTPAQASYYLKKILQCYALAPVLTAFGGLQTAAKNGWQSASVKFTQGSARYALQKQRAGLGNTVGVVSGATRDFYTLQDGTFLQVTEKYIKLLGGLLSYTQLSQRKKVGGGLPGYRNGSCPQRRHSEAQRYTGANSTGRRAVYDNRITPAYAAVINNIRANILTPRLDFKTGGSYESLLAALPIPIKLIKKAQGKQLVFKVTGGQLQPVTSGWEGAL